VVGYNADEDMDDDLRNMVWKGHYLGAQPSDVMMHVPVDSYLQGKNDKVKIFGPYHLETIAVARVQRIGRSAARRPRAGSLHPREDRRGRPTLADAFLLGVLNGRLRENVVHFASVAAAVDKLKAGELAAVMGPRSEIEAALGKDALRHRSRADARTQDQQLALGMAVKADEAALADASPARSRNCRRTARSQPSSPATASPTSPHPLTHAPRPHACCGPARRPDPAPGVLAAPFAYVPNEKSATVSVIDTATDTVVRTLPGGQRPRGIATDGKHLYISEAPATAWWWSTSTRQAGQEHPPGRVAGRRQRVGRPSPDRGGGGGIQQRGAAGCRKRAIAEIKVRAKPEHAVFSPDGRWLLVSAENAEQVDLIDVKARRQVGSIPVGKRPRGIGFTPDGKRAYVACELASTVYAIDMDSRR
jgi:YVTN family beta-propeller protein